MTMKVQINCDTDVNENELRYIYQNLPSVVRKYKNSTEYRQQKLPKRYSWERRKPWTYKMDGKGMLGIGVVSDNRRIKVTGNNDRLIFTIQAYYRNKEKEKQKNSEK